MILQPKDITFAYRCPACGSTVYSMVGALALSGDMIKLKCSCGGSSLTLEKTSDDKIRITVPCVFCPNPHRYVVSKSLLTKRDLFTFPCSYSGIDALFIGTKGEVMKAVELSDKEIQSLIDDTELAHIQEGSAGDGFYGDEHVRDLVVFVLGDLAEEHHIHCGCGTEGDFLVEPERDHVKISCKKCGYHKEISCAGSTLETEAFLDCRDLYLQAPEKK